MIFTFLVMCTNIKVTRMNAAGVLCPWKVIETSDCVVRFAQVCLARSLVRPLQEK